MKIVILDGAGANPGDISWAPLERFGEVIAYDYTSKEQVVERASGAEICITNKTVFDQDTIEKLPALKYIGVLATGFNVVDLECCRKHGVTVTNVPEYATYATAQMTIALLLELACLPGRHSNDVMDGGWVKSPQFSYFLAPLTELMGKNMLIIGFGKIGRRVAAIASSLGMNVSAVPHHAAGRDSAGNAPGGRGNVPPEAPARADKNSRLGCARIAADDPAADYFLFSRPRVQKPALGQRRSRPLYRCRRCLCH